MTLVRRINARRGRALGEVSKALLAALGKLQGDGVAVGFPLRRVCVAAQVGVDAGRVYMSKLVAAGHVVVVGSVPVPDRNRPAQLYALPGAVLVPQEQGSAVLWSCIHSAWLPVGPVREIQDQETA